LSSPHSCPEEPIPKQFSCSAFQPNNWRNPLNAELNPICHLLALLGAHRILHVSRIRVKAVFFSLLHRACCFEYFFNIPTHALIINTLKSTKFTLKHLKTLKICPYMFRSILRPSSGGSWTVLYAFTKLRSVDARSLQICALCGRMSLPSVCVCIWSTWLGETLSYCIVHKSITSVHQPISS